VVALRRPQEPLPEALHPPPAVLPRPGSRDGTARSRGCARTQQGQQVSYPQGEGGEGTAGRGSDQQRHLKEIWRPQKHFINRCMK
jgi:hypothetical protein